MKLRAVIWFGVWVAVTWLPWLQAHAEFVVRKVEMLRDGEQILVSTDIELNLPSEVESAVNNGVPLVLLTELKLVQDWFIWKETISDTRIRSELRYHSLSDHYIVKSSESERIEMFRSVGEALKRIGSVRSLALNLPPEDGVRRGLAVRSHLDINALPGPLRPMAFLSPSWRLNTDWTHWRVIP